MSLHWRGVVSSPVLSRLRAFHKKQESNGSDLASDDTFRSLIGPYRDSKASKTDQNVPKSMYWPLHPNLFNPKRSVQQLRLTAWAMSAATRRARVSSLRVGLGRRLRVSWRRLRKAGAADRVSHSGSVIALRGAFFVDDGVICSEGAISAYRTSLCYLRGQIHGPLIFVHMTLQDC